MYVRDDAVVRNTLWLWRIGGKAADNRHGPEWITEAVALNGWFWYNAAHLLREGVHYA